jgi:GTPase involved in cell partitioning and DNA repair
MSQGSNFVDYVKICCRSGHGGAGSSHLHRDKHTAMGGPDGGDGGRGGHVIVKGNAQLWTYCISNSANMLLPATENRVAVHRKVVKPGAMKYWKCH